MDAETTLPLKETLSKLPPEVPSTDLASTIAQRQSSSSQLPILVILDDDPTGTQTCHGINVLTVWDQPTLIEEFNSVTSNKSSGGFFILTNSRALHTPEARSLTREICLAVKRAAKAAGGNTRFEFVLRGDSTLRGHFPDEPEVAEEVVCGRRESGIGSGSGSGSSSSSTVDAEGGDEDRKVEVDGWILAPFFRQGGRLTINDVHYVADYPNDKLVPAAQTPFAKDASFGYRNSDLRKYVVEKSKGKIGEERVKSVSLEDVRVGGVGVVARKLKKEFPRGSVVVVNAVVDTDMEVFVQGLLEASSSGKRYIYRTGAAFVSTRLGISPIPPLTPTSLSMDTSPSAPGGLIIAGSYVPKTTSQLECLTSSLAPHSLEVITLSVEPLLSSPQSKSATITSAVSKANSFISAGRDVLFMTSRNLITGDDEASSLKIGAVVADALVEFLAKLSTRPRYIIAKGGITSSDAATKGLKMRRAEIVGQAASGVPLWRCDEETSKFAGIPYVVFPGNVGEKETLRDLVVSWGKKS